MVSKLLVVLAVLGVGLPIAIIALAPRTSSLEAMANEEKIEIKRDSLGFMEEVTVHRRVEG